MLTTMGLFAPTRPRGSTSRTPASSPRTFSDPGTRESANSGRRPSIIESTRAVASWSKGGNASGVR
ncbi:hypothetical protein [Cellulosimicrobium sp. NPDC055967]|uniref:hypothetical protein n=1 Tax=Cellulosimicrobium sp. NPDC055967 TaxID=3345670 RepID=UPI0035D5552C